MNLPKWPNEAPNLTNKSNEDSHAGSISAIAIHSVSDKHGSDNLIAGGSNTNAHKRRDIVSRASIVELHQENDKANDAKRKAKVAQP